MPMLPNTTDIDAKQVDPKGVNLPGMDGINRIEKQVAAENYVEKKVDILPSITPPSDFVSKKVDDFGVDLEKGKTIDVEFESYFNSRTKELSQGTRQKQVESDKQRFIKMSDDIFAKQKEELAGSDNVRKQAIYGIADFAQEAVGSAVEFKNVARRFFGMSELNDVPDLASQLPEPKTSQERFVRSTTKLMTGLIPIARGLKAVTGVAGVANSMASSGIYGFLFDDNQTDGLVNDFVKDNFELAPDILSYLNHETDDSKFVTRLKNSANYVVDDVAFEGAFYALKIARNLSKGREQAYKLLENGDVEVKAKKVENTSLFETVIPESLPKVAGLTTEDIGKKSAKDTIDEEIKAAREEIKKKYETKQASDPDRMTQGRSEAMAEIEKNPMSLKQLLAIPENSPVSNLVVMQAEIAQNALTRVADNIIDGVTKNTQDPTLALYKLTNIAEAMNKLSFPRSTAGRALESAKFISSLDDVKKLDVEQLKRLNQIFGQDAKAITEEYKLVKDNLTGFPIADATLNGIRENVDLKKTWQYISTARINWILSDPTIHTANVMSNTTTMGLRSATELTAAGVTKARSILGNKYLAMGVDASEAKSTIQGYITGMGKAFSIIKDNMGTLAKEGPLPTSGFKSLYSRDSNTKYNEGIDKIINDSETANNYVDATLGKQTIKLLGHMVAGTPVGKMLSWEDDIFKGMHYMAEVNKQLAMKENMIARQASQILDPVEADAYLKEEMKVVNTIRDNFKNGKLDVEIDKEAKQAANYWTFNSELVGEDALTKALKWGGDFRTINPALHWFIPFYRTGANIANMSMEYTPVIGGILKMGNVGGMSGLLRGGREADTFIAKQAIGSMIMASAATAYSLLEDKFGIDFEIGSLKNNKVGFKIGGVETTLDKQTPIFKIFIAAKDIMDISNIAGQPEGASVAVKAAASLLVEMYSPDQLVQLLGSISDISNPQAADLPKQFENILKMNVLLQVTPYSGAARFINRDVEGMNKVIQGQERGEDLLDEMLKRIKHTYLGDDANIPVRRGLFGQEIPYLRTMGYQVSDNAHDMMAGYSMNDPIVQEIFKLTREEVMSNPENYDSFDLNNTTFLQMPKRNITLPTGESYDLTPKEYSDYVQASAGEHKMFKGMSLKKTLDEYIVSDEYKSLPPKFKVTTIKDIVGLYRKAAKGIILNDHYEIMLEAKESLIRLEKEYQNVK